mmetsp:Transcript_4473/g.9398  ORF Transcript_4473/g.9398 Transcript_4473/m.9398 type:complete len:211 (-) Transcript_4473:1114-1746(-)
MLLELLSAVCVDVEEVRSGAAVLTLNGDLDGLSNKTPSSRSLDWVAEKTSSSLSFDGAVTIASLLGLFLLGNDCASRFQPVRRRPVHFGFSPASCRFSSATFEPIFMSDALVVWTSDCDIAFDPALTRTADFKLFILCRSESCFCFHDGRKMSAWFGVRLSVFVARKTPNDESPTSRPMTVRECAASGLLVVLILSVDGLGPIDALKRFS